MTPDPTLTDEELAEIQLAGPWEPTDLVPRLIAALRASRAEAEELKAKVDYYREWLISEGYNLGADI